MKRSTAQEGNGAGEIHTPNPLYSNISTPWNLPSDQKAGSAQTHRTAMSIIPLGVTAKTKPLNAHPQGIRPITNSAFWDWGIIQLFKE